MNAEEAFRAGLASVNEDLRRHGIGEVTGGCVPVLAAYFVFEKRARHPETDPRFPTDAPKFARRCILDALASGK